MGHLPVGGASGSLGALPRLGAKRTVLVHINNTNPILCRGSAERAQVEAAGVEVGGGGMAVGLGRRRPTAPPGRRAGPSAGRAPPARGPTTTLIPSTPRRHVGDLEP